MTASTPPPDLVETPHPHEFAEQLIRQVLADLDGILFDGEAAADDAFELIRAKAGAGQARGALLPVMARASLAAHRALIFGWGGEFDAVHDADAGDVVSHLVPESGTHIPALFEHATRLANFVALTEQSRESLHTALGKAVFHLYEGMRSEDATMGGRGLLELRSMVVHLDAAAQMLESGNVEQAARVIRPDRFHDYFMRFVSRAQSSDADGEERAIAALSCDGRIEAVIAEDAAHPVRLAADEVRAAVIGDEMLKDHAVVRIRALLAFLGGLRRKPVAMIGDALADQTVYLSLVVAAATAPLLIGSDFEFAPIAQIARYNQTLLRGARNAEGVAH